MQWVIYWDELAFLFVLSVVWFRRGGSPRSLYWLLVSYFYRKCLNINLVSMGSTRPLNLCKPNPKQAVFLLFIFQFLSFICLSRPHLVLSAPLQQDIPDIITSKSDSQFDFKFNFGGNSVRTWVWVGHDVTNIGALLLEEGHVRFLSWTQWG